MWYLRCRLTGLPVSCNYSAYGEAEQSAGTSMLLEIAPVIGGEWYRWWPKRQTMNGRLSCDVGHSCPLPGAEYPHQRWRCDWCGKAYVRDFVTRYPQCWYRDALFDAQWRDNARLPLPERP